MVAVSYRTSGLPADQVVVLFVLLVEPRFERREIVGQRRSIHLSLAREGSQAHPAKACSCPAPAWRSTSRQLSCCRRWGSGARPLIPSFLAQRPLKLELVKAREEELFAVIANVVPNIHRSAEAKDLLVLR